MLKNNNEERRKGCQLDLICINDIINKLETTMLNIGTQSHSLAVWLEGEALTSHSANNNANQFSVAALRAGLQAAAIATRMEDILFFLEQLNHYVITIKKYLSALEASVGFAPMLKTLRKLGNHDLASTFSQMAPLKHSTADYALYCVFQQCDYLWTACIAKDGAFPLNISLSSVSGDLPGFESTATEGEAIIKKMTDGLKQLKIEFKALKSSNELTNQPLKLSIKNQIIDAVNTANQVFKRLTPEMFGINGIQQVSRGSNVAMSVMERWTMVGVDILPPPFWNKEQAVLTHKIQKLGAILQKWMINPEGKGIEEHKEAGALLWRRTSLSFSILDMPKQKKQIIKFPPDISENQVNQLIEVIIPPTPRQVLSYEQIIKVIMNIKDNDRVWGAFKKYVMSNTDFNPIQKENIMNFR